MGSDIPPAADAEFIAAMEDVLDTYEQPYDANYPVLCMDEQPVQLHKEIRKPIAATKRHARRVDYEYERCGTACLFMFTEPLSGWRDVRVRDQRTKVDWAIEMERLLTTRYRKAKKVILICDNLNTHTRGAFYETFPAARARELVGRLEFRYTPKHGSWLNIAENELSTMTRQCVSGRRFATRNSEGLIGNSTSSKPDASLNHSTPKLNPDEAVGNKYTVSCGSSTPGPRRCGR